MSLAADPRHDAAALARLIPSERGPLLLVPVLAPPAPPPSLSALSAAEQKVVELAGQGWSNRAIARLTHKRSRTVANQLQAAYRKLGIGSRAELFARPPALAVVTM